jgi:3-hydroxyacyl-CoA dehydrogenase/enoyl-CoA hydratase/carnithine racemase
MPDTEFKLQRVGDLALVTIDNGEDWTKPSVFGRAAMESLQRTLDQIEAQAWRALVLTGKPFVFAAGADLDEFPKMTTPELAIAGSRAGHELFGRLRALPFPTVAAINGVCLGGGLEIALHCDARTIATSVRHFGFPECFLGLIPGWGGTQLAPRLVGPLASVKVIVQNAMRQNRMLDAREAFELGFADRLLEPAEFLDNSIAFARELSSAGGVERPGVDWSQVGEIVQKARLQLDDSVHGAAPAPYRALDLIAGAATWSVEEGYRKEEEAIGELLPGRQAQASVYAFDLVERRAKRGVGIPDVEARNVRKVGIVGAGLMATQLATLFVRRLEVPVALRDIDQEIVDRALESIREELEGAVARGRLTEDKARFLGSIVSGSTDLAGFADCDFVLEAVVEEMEVKQHVFAELRRIAPDTILATNTSSLSVAEMGADVGLHFFNPVALLPLVELIRTPDTEDETLATTYEVARKLGKRAVLVKDAPAFVVNRILTRLMTVVLDAIEHGNTPDETDAAILRLGLPMAPSVLLQMVGPRVANHVLETLHEAYPGRFPLSPTLASYAAGTWEPVVVEERPRSADELLEDVLVAVADEVRHILDEGVVADAKDVDTALLLGAGWPFFLGGITKYLDQTGYSERLFGHKFGEPAAAGELLTRGISAY